MSVAALTLAVPATVYRRSEQRAFWVGFFCMLIACVGGEIVRYLAATGPQPPPAER